MQVYHKMLLNLISKRVNTIPQAYAPLRRLLMALFIPDMLPQRQFHQDNNKVRIHNITLLKFKDVTLSLKLFKAFPLSAAKIPKGY
jgi:hypothetical protein